METEIWQYPYTPTPRQKQAHKSTADELLFGGAAGGGKSSWLLASAVITCLLIPGAQALVFRRTYPDLKRSLIPRLLEQIPRHIGTYNSQDHAWSFANGSRLELAHLQHENDIYNYQGAEAQLVAFDELTQFTETQYKYLLSRVRAGGAVLERMQKLGMTPRVIASANPGGIGHHWVKARFIDHGRPGDVWQPKPSDDEPEPLTRCFIPSLLTDNPHLDQVQYRRQLQALDPVLRKALLTGNWDILEGVRFTAWDRAVHVITPELLPAPVVGAVRAVGVDYGLSAPFAALWGAKLADDLVLVYRELYKADLTPRQQAELIRDSEAEGERRPERPIQVALDPSTWTRNPNKPVGPVLVKDEPPPGSIAWQYQQVLGKSVVKARNERVAGWALLDHHLVVRRDGLPRILVHDTCVNLIRTLPTMPRDKKNPEDINTHAEDHACFPAGTMIQTASGEKSIHEVQAGEMVATRDGWRKVLEAGMTLPNAETGTVEFSDGSTLEGTRNHPVITANRGVVSLDALRYSDILISWEQVSQSYSTGSHSGAIQSRRIGRNAHTSFQAATTGSGESDACIKKYGKPLMARFLKVCRSTTKITTRSTTTSETLFSSAKVSTAATTQTNLTASSISKPNTLRGEKRRSFGTEAPKAGCGIPNTERGHGKEESRSGASAVIAAKTTKYSLESRVSSAQTTARPNTDVSQVSITSRRSVLSAGQRSNQTSTSNPNPAPLRVARSWESSGVQPVYNLKVEGSPEYFANGVLVHNCDALRYLLMELVGKERARKADPREQPAETITGSLYASNF